jgi:hypothetical protein
MICSSFVYHKNINLNINCTSLIFTDKRSNTSIIHHRPASQIAYINKMPAYNSDTASCLSNNLTHTETLTNNVGGTPNKQ